MLKYRFKKINSVNKWGWANIREKTICLYNIGFSKQCWFFAIELIDINIARYWLRIWIFLIKFVKNLMDKLTLRNADWIIWIKLNWIPRKQLKMAISFILNKFHLKQIISLCSFAFRSRPFNSIFLIEFFFFSRGK